MSSVARTNGSNTTIGTIYSPNANIFVITVKNAAATAKNLSTEDSAGVDALVDGAVESIVKELSPMAWITDGDQVANAGKMYVVMDVNLNNAAELQVRVRRLGAVGPNATDISGTTITDATAFTAI